MDTCRPLPDGDAGDADLCLLSYLDCFDGAFKEYTKRVDGAHFVDTFAYVAMHTPFGGMIKGAHRDMMRKVVKATPQETEADFKRRIMPGLTSASASATSWAPPPCSPWSARIEHGEFDTPQRVGVFSYGSGCCSEFFSGVVTKEGQERVRAMRIRNQLDKRAELTMEEYEPSSRGSSVVKFGTRNTVLDTTFLARAGNAQGNGTMFLTEIKDFHAAIRPDRLSSPLAITRRSWEPSPTAMNPRGERELGVPRAAARVSREKPVPSPRNGGERARVRGGSHAKTRQTPAGPCRLSYSLASSATASPTTRRRSTPEYCGRVNGSTNRLLTWFRGHTPP